MNPDEAENKLNALTEEFRRFSEHFIQDIGRVSHVHGKLVAGLEVMRHRLSAAEQAKLAMVDNHTELKARNDALQDEINRARLDLTTALRRLERQESELHLSRHQHASLQQRFESMESDYGRSLSALDTCQNELIATRHDLEVISPKYETLQVELEHSRSRNASLEARIRILTIEAEAMRNEIVQQRQQLDDSVKDQARLKEELETIADRERVLLAQRDELVEEKDRLAAEVSKLSGELGGDRRAIDTKIYALSRTKEFLWQVSEKQRRQLAEQLTRISQLERSNSKLSEMLMEADKGAMKQDELPAISSAAEQNGSKKARLQ